MHITALVQRELSQKDGDALVAEAKQAVAAEEQNLEPDLALLTTADFEVLAPTATQRGQETVRAMQATLLSDTGNPNLTDQQMQHMVLDGLADMQLAEHLAIQSHKIRMRAITRLRPPRREVLRKDSPNLWVKCFAVRSKAPQPRAPLKAVVILKLNPALVPPLPRFDLLPPPIRKNIVLSTSAKLCTRLARTP